MLLPLPHTTMITTLLLPLISLYMMKSMLSIVMIILLKKPSMLITYTMTPPTALIGALSGINIKITLPYLFILGMLPTTMVLSPYKIMLLLMSMLAMIMLETMTETKKYDYAFIIIEVGAATNNDEYITIDKDAYIYNYINTFISKDATMYDRNCATIAVEIEASTENFNDNTIYSFKDDTSDTNDDTVIHVSEENYRYNNDSIFIIIEVAV